MRVKYDNVDKVFDTEKSSINKSYDEWERNDMQLYKLPFLNDNKLEHTLIFFYPFQIAIFILKGK